MGLWHNIWRRIAGGKTVPTGRRTEVLGGSFHGTLSPYRSRVSNILQELRSIREEADAIDFLSKVTPDVSMAVWNFVRLANQGHEMHFYASKDKENRMTELEPEWREFSARVNDVSNSGLDGLLDVLHRSAFMRGAQGLEVEVNKQRTDIVEVHPVVPQTIEWEVEEREGRRVFIPYQQQHMKKVSLEPAKANFFWVPTDADIDDPRGNLLLAPVLQAVDFQMQILQDLQAVLHRQGWPRNDIKIMLERVLTRMPQEVKSGKKKIDQWLTEIWDEVKAQMDNLEPDSDYIHYDDIEVNVIEGGNTGRSLDVRAIMEMVDIQAMGGSKQMSIFMNRNQGVTETWGTVQFMIFCNGIASIQRGSKRLMEEVARLWLRVKGKQAVPVFTHNKLDWNSEEQRMTVKLMQEEFWAIAQLLGWATPDQATQEVTGNDKAVGQPDPERVRVTFSAGGGINSGHDKHQRTDTEREDDSKVSYLRTGR